MNVEPLRLTGDATRHQGRLQVGQVGLKKLEDE